MKILLKKNTVFGMKGEIRDIDKDTLATYSPDTYEVQKEAKEAKEIENKAILTPKSTKKVK